MRPVPIWHNINGSFSWSNSGPADLWQRNKVKGPRSKDNASECHSPWLIPGIEGDTQKRLLDE